MRRTRPSLDPPSPLAADGSSDRPPSQQSRGVYCSSHEYGEMKTTTPSSATNEGSAFRRSSGFGRRQRRFAPCTTWKGPPSFLTSRLHASPYMNLMRSVFAPAGREAVPERQTSASCRYVNGSFPSVCNRDAAFTKAFEKSIPTTSSNASLSLNDVAPTAQPRSSALVLLGVGSDARRFLDHSMQASAVRTGKSNAYVGPLLYGRNSSLEP